mmetsp:Transcript_15158/g.34645  ORF Transcript_15158/g.34645 Transcript_15158/m.34645 type:complete len:330 (-) Transcript_15158:1348-2337(-)
MEKHGSPCRNKSNEGYLGAGSAFLFDLQGLGASWDLHLSVSLMLVFGVIVILFLGVMLMFGVIVIIFLGVGLRNLFIGWRLARDIDRSRKDLAVSPVEVENHTVRGAMVPHKVILAVRPPDQRVDSVEVEPLPVDFVDLEGEGSVAPVELERHVGEVWGDRHCPVAERRVRLVDLVPGHAARGRVLGISYLETRGGGVGCVRAGRGEDDVRPVHAVVLSPDVSEAEGEPAKHLVGDDAAVELAVLDGVEEVRLISFENGAVEVLSVRLGEVDLVLVVALIGEGLPGGKVTNLLVLLLNGGVGRDRMRLGAVGGADWVVVTVTLAGRVDL